MNEHKGQTLSWQMLDGAIELTFIASLATKLVR